MLSSNSQAVHVGNFLPRRRATASCTRVDEICTDRPEERNPNCDPACRPILSGRRVSPIHLWDNSQYQTKLPPLQLPPEVHPPEARHSSHINRTLSWTKTCREQSCCKAEWVSWWLWDQGFGFRLSLWLYRVDWSMLRILSELWLASFRRIFWEKQILLAS